MAPTHIYLGDKELTKKQTEALAKKFDKKTLTFEYVNSDTKPDGRFLSTKQWTVDLWPLIQKEIGYPPATKALKVTSGIDRPGTYTVEIEVFGNSYKAKVVIKQKSGDTSSPEMKPGANPSRVTVRPAGGFNKNVLPAEFKSDLASLIQIMSKATNYSWTGDKGVGQGWKMDFAPHFSKFIPGKGWKVYVDASQGTGTTWRMLFTIAYDGRAGAMLVQPSQIYQEH